MNCHECQRLLCESHDERGTASLPTEAERHLDGCVSCQDFLADWLTLDAGLVRHAASAKLSPGFKDRVMSKLEEGGACLSQEKILRRRDELEREYRQMLSELDRHYLIPQTLKVLHLLAVGGACVLSGFILGELIRNSPAVSVDSTALQKTLAGLAQALGWSAGFGAVLVGLRRMWLPAVRSLPFRDSIRSLLR